MHQSDKGLPRISLAGRGQMLKALLSISLAGHGKLVKIPRTLEPHGIF